MSCAEKRHPALSTIAADIPFRIWPRWAAAVWGRFCRAMELQRQRRELLELDDRQLADIGVSREQSLREASKLFWTRV